MGVVSKLIVIGALDTQNLENFTEVSILAYRTLIVFISLSREDGYLIVLLLNTKIYKVSVFVLDICWQEMNVVKWDEHKSCSVFQE